MVNDALSEAPDRLPVHGGLRVPLRVVDFGRRGRGVVAGRRIEAGELVERSPVLIIPHAQRAAIDPTNVGNYIFLWEPGTTGQDIYRQEGRAAIALGYTSLVNHSARPNCAFTRHFDALVLDLHALREIEPGEEITFDYGMTLWFEPE
jgi:SET domain-containing protein